MVGDDEASKVYVRNKHRAAEKIGIKTIDETMPADSKQEDVIKMIEKYNNDPDVHGILVQMPLPKHIDEKAIIDAIDPKKDVDGSHPENMGRLFMNGPKRFHARQEESWNCLKNMILTSEDKRS